MIKRRIIESLDEIFDFSRKQNSLDETLPYCLIEDKNFSNLDLSKLDLSSIKPDFWNGARFYNSNFSNTGIKFNPQNLVYKSVEMCEFENVDFSYLNPKSFDDVYIQGSNFRNTNIDISLVDCRGHIDKVKLDKLYGNKPRSYWDNFYFEKQFLQLNPFIKISSEKLWRCIRQKEKLNNRFLTDIEIEEYLHEFEEWLKYDDGSITNFYNSICKNSPEKYKRLNFFNGIVCNIIFDTITIEENSSFILSELSVFDCVFKEIICKMSVSKLTTQFINTSIFSKHNKLEKVSFSDLNYHTWTEVKKNSIGRITFRTNLYLELGNQCNCNCCFCRNNSFEENKKTCKFNLKSIKKNLQKLFPYLDTVFIGGGEPTLKMDAIKSLVALRNKSISNPNFVIVTNGSVDENLLYELELNHDDAIYVSRHEISDENNKKILNPNPNTKIVSLDDLKWFSVETVLSPVCVKGGLDSSEKIAEYLSSAMKLGFNQVIISSLQKSASLGTNEIDYDELYVDSKIFEEVKKALRMQEYEEKLPIYSTGGYVLNIFHKGVYKVIFKEYISREEEDEYRKNSLKINFDLTMTQNGDVFEDWRREHKVDLSLLNYKSN